MEEAATHYRAVINNKKLMGDQKYIANIYLQSPNECEISSINDQIGRYDLFIKKFQKIKFTPEALAQISWFNRYLFNCYETDSDIKHMFEKHKKYL